MPDCPVKNSTTKSSFIFASIKKRLMKKLVFICCLLISSASVFAQFEKDSSELINRLGIYFKHNEAMDFDKMIDFLYPKIFTLSSKEEVKSSLEEAFTNDEMSIKMDSLKIVKVFPIFSIDTNKYAKITYSMIISMTYKETAKDSSGMKPILEAVQGQYGKENAWLDAKGKTLMIFQKVDMAAIIDDLSPAWTFINLDKNDPSLEIFLSKDILDRFYAN
jgi:hypothetical protein